jgi:hypothetical protein
MPEGNFHRLWQTGNGEVSHLALKPAQSAFGRHGGEGTYEQLSKQSFVVYLTTELIDFCGF